MTSNTKYPANIAADFQQADSLSGQAAFGRYYHRSRKWYWNASYEYVGDDFRADSGFIPQVGYGQAIAGLERTFWPAKDKKTWWSRMYWGGDWDRTTETRTGNQLEEEWEMWFGVGGPKQSFANIDFGTRDRFFNGVTFNNEKFLNVHAEVTPHKRVYVSAELNAGSQIDFANTRPATRVRLSPFIRFKATRHLELSLGDTNERLYVDDGRLYTADVAEFRAVYQFNVRMFVRAIVQYSDIDRDPSLYKFAVDSHSQRVFPQFLFSYKVNPQTVLFVGYSSTRLANDTYDVTVADRTLFVKVGYAWAM